MDGVLDGNFTLTAGETSVEPPPGDMPLHQRGDAHQVTAVGGLPRPFADEPGAAAFSTWRTAGVRPDRFRGHHRFHHFGAADAA